MIARTAFRVFLTCLTLCASLVLIAIWLGEDWVVPLYFQVTATTFILGLASFLVWFSLTLRSILTLLQKKS